MAITNSSAKFLFYCKNQGVSFDNTLTLGRLRFYGTVDYINTLIKKFNVETTEIERTLKSNEFAEPLFKLLGATNVDSIDYSNYQQATIIHDLNQRIPVEMHNKYTCVLDSGTIEHIFNFPVAIENCMSALKTGGCYVGMTPANNTMGHGFYQFSPELYYNVFSSQNGFEIFKMIITTSNETGENENWYEVMNPAEVGERVVLANTRPTYLIVIAKKIKDVKVFSSFPQQSDYVEAWAKSTSSSDIKLPWHKRAIKYLYNRILPFKLQMILSAVYKELKSKHLKTEDIGIIDSRSFKKMDV